MAIMCYKILGCKQVGRGYDNTRDLAGDPKHSTSGQCLPSSEANNTGFEEWLPQQNYRIGAVWEWGQIFFAAAALALAALSW